MFLVATLTENLRSGFLVQAKEPQGPGGPPVRELRPAAIRISKMASSGLQITSYMPSGRQVITRIDSLIRLYQIYRYSFHYGDHCVPLAPADG